MFKKLKRYFIPNEGNDHRPHILRPQAVAFVCLIAIAAEGVFLFGSSFVIPRVKLFGLIIANALVDSTNQARAAADLPALRESGLLDAAAQEKANDMVTNNYFAHTSPSGLTPWYWFQNVGYQFAVAGENLAVDFADSSDVTNAWLNSPEHRANIMNAGFSEIGMATAQGEFEGHPAVYVVELFGTPPVSVIPSVAAAPLLVATNTTNSASQQNLAVVKGAQTEAVSATTAGTATTAGRSLASTQAPAQSPSPQTNLVQGAFADPRRTVDYFYFGIAIFFAIALFLNIFIKIRIQHPQLILGGMLVILLAGLFIVLNQHFGTSGGVIV
ncbi:MAG: CAP domain-containing protein [Minisyncoccia bacterium]|jgi:hypothetical protein